MTTAEQHSLPPASAGPFALYRHVIRQRHPAAVTDEVFAHCNAQVRSLREHRVILLYRYLNQDGSGPYIQLTPAEQRMHGAKLGKLEQIAAYREGALAKVGTPSRAVDLVQEYLSSWPPRVA